MAKVRPNAPCPCGSGKKYKKCCRLVDSVPSQATPTQSSLSSSQFETQTHGKIELIVEWLFNQSWGKWYMDAYLRHYSGLVAQTQDKEDRKDKDKAPLLDERSVQAIMELAIFEGLMGSQTPLEMFAQQADLSSLEQEYYQSWVQEHLLSFFEIKQLELGQGLKLVDLITQQEYYVKEKKATHELQTGMTLIARLVPHQDYWIMTGGVGSAFPAGFATHFRQSMAQQDSGVPSEKPTQRDLMKAGFISEELKQRVNSIPEEQVLEDFYDLATVEQALKIFGQELGAGELLDEYLQQMRSQADVHQAQNKLRQVISQCTDQRQIERLLRLMKCWSNLLPSNQENSCGPVESKLVQELSDYVGKHRSLDSQTKKGKKEAKRLMNQWLDKPQKKLEFKTAREAILEERAALGNSEKRVSYSFFSFPGGSHADGLSQAQSQLYNQAVKQLQNGETMEALEKLSQLTAVVPEMSESFRWYANVGSALTELAQLDLAKKFFQQALQLNPDYKMAQNNLDVLGDQELRPKILEHGLINLWRELHRGRWSLKLEGNQQLEGLLVKIEVGTEQITTQPPDFLSEMHSFLEYAVDKKIKLTPKRKDITLKQVKELNLQLATPDPEDNKALVGAKDASTKYRMESEFPQVRLLHMLALAAGWMRVAVSKGKTARPRLVVTPKGKKWLRCSIEQQFDELLVNWWSQLNWGGIFDFGSLGTSFATQRMTFYQDILVILLRRLFQAKSYVNFSELTKLTTFDKDVSIWLSPLIMERDILTSLQKARLIEPKNKKLVLEKRQGKDWDQLEKKKSQQAYRLTRLGRVVWSEVEREMKELVPEAVAKMSEGIELADSPRFG